MKRLSDILTAEIPGLRVLNREIFPTRHDWMISFFLAILGVLILWPLLPHYFAMFWLALAAVNSADACRRLGVPRRFTGPVMAATIVLYAVMLLGCGLSCFDIISIDVKHGPQSTWIGAAFVVLVVVNSLAILWTLHKRERGVPPSPDDPDRVLPWLSQDS